MWVHNIWKYYEILFLLNDIAYNDIAYYSMKEEVGEKGMILLPCIS